MSQKDESEVLEELFGASDDENENLKLEEESEEIEELKTKTKTAAQRTKMTRKKTSEDSSEEEGGGSAEVDGNWLLTAKLLKLNWNSLDKILEARRDFEEALSKLKGPRRRKGTDSDSVVQIALSYFFPYFTF